MSQGSRRNVWLRHAAIALGYALGYLLVRHVSWSHWLLFAGYRLSVLMLVPYRYWPALLVGELGPMTYDSISCAQTFGWLWAALMLVPPLALVMPLVKYCRDRLHMIPTHGPVRLRVVLACTLAASLIWTIGYLVVLSTTRLPADFGPINYPAAAARWVIGNYLGVLTVVPVVLLIREGRAKQFESWRTSLGRAVRSPLAIEAATCVLPALVLLTWLARETSSESLRGMVQMSMFVPALWLALRQGWHGAALGGAGASIAIAVTMPQLYDPATLQSEALVAFAVSSMLLFGSRMAVPHRQVASDGGDSGSSLDLARRIQAQCEIQLQQSALGIDRAGETVHAAENLLFDRSPSRPSAVDVRELRRLATATQEQLFQLADSLNPVSLREQGLEAALRQGGIARALDAHRIRYWCQLRSSVDRLSPTLQLSIYRLVCEGVSYLCAQHPVGCLTLRVRHAMRRGRHLVFVQISAQFFGDSGALLRVPSTLQRRLSVTGRGIDAIKDRAALHEGVVRMRGSDRGACIRVLLLDHAVRQPERVAPVPRATPVILAPS